MNVSGERVRWLCASALVATACGAAGATVQAATQVKVVRVGPAGSVAEKQWLGSAAAAGEYVVSSPSAGVLKRCPWKPGQRVAKGQVLLEVLSHDLLDELALVPHQLARYRAELKQAEVDLELLKLGPRAEQLAGMEEQAKLTRDGLAETKRQLAIIERRLEIEQRFGDARRQLSPLEDQFDRLTSARTGMLIQLSRIESELIMLRLKPRQQELDKAAAGVGVKKAQIDLTAAQQKQLKARLARNVVKAPFDALIVDVKRREGGLVRQDEELLRLAPAGRLEAVIEMPEEEYLTLAPTLRKRAFRARTVAGGLVMTCRWTRTAPQADERTRVVKVHLTVDSPPPVLLAGMSLRIELLARSTAAPDAGLLVPGGCVVRDAGRTRVWLVRRGLAVARDVVVRAHSERLVRVVKGLALGDQVIVDPPAGLKELSAVEVTPTGRD